MSETIPNSIVSYEIIDDTKSLDGSTEAVSVLAIDNNGESFVIHFRTEESMIRLFDEGAQAIQHGDYIEEEFEPEWGLPVPSITNELISTIFKEVGASILNLYLIKQDMD